MPNLPRHVALVPAAGSGQRFGTVLPKQYALLAGQPMLTHTVSALLDFESFDSVVVVVSPSDTLAQAALAELLILEPKRLQIVFKGGVSRSQTVRNGLAHLQALDCDANTWIWVHDAARPAVALAQLQYLARALSDSDTPVGAVLATPVADTLKKSNTANGLNHHIAATLDRDRLWQAQTPQCFGLAALCQALDAAALAGNPVTDEASAMELQGLSPIIVQGTSHNFKVTTQADAQLMEAVLTMSLIPKPQIERSISEALGKPAQLSPLRIGEGMDVHALVAGRPLILGGVNIPHPKGLLGHSDADALLHAITDALLGAAGLGDIGRIFPDTDVAHAGADSQVLLKTAYAAVCAAGWIVVNVDATIVAQAPKMSPHISVMQRNIATCLDVDVSQVNVKAKTNEKLGWLGREEGIETRAVVLLQACQMQPVSA